MPILQSLETSTVVGELPGTAADPRVRVLLGGGGRASAFELRRLVAADPGLVAVGVAAAAQETLHQAEDLQPDVVVLDRSSSDVVQLARELTSLERPPGVVVRSDCPDPVMTIAAIVAGVRGIVSRSDPEGALFDAIRWVAGNSRWLPEIPLTALSRASSRLHRDDVPILLMLLRGAASPGVATQLGISAASLDARRSAMLRDMLGDPAAAWSHRPWRGRESAPPASEPDPRTARWTGHDRRRHQGKPISRRNPVPTEVRLVHEYRREYQAIPVAQEAT